MTTKTRKKTERVEFAGARLRALRENAGLTQRELAERISRDNETVSRWERGYRPIPRRHYRALAEGLGLTVDQMLSDEPWPKPEPPKLEQPDGGDPPASLSQEEAAVVEALRRLPPGPRGRAIGYVLGLASRAPDEAEVAAAAGAALEPAAEKRTGVEPAQEPRRKTGA